MAEKGNLPSIIFQIKTEVITCLRLAESVDYVVAAGTRSGKVFVFQLPSLLPGRVKRVNHLKHFNSFVDTPVQ